MDLHTSFKFPDVAASAPKALGGVLVVEDDPLSRQAMVRLLEMLGYRAESAEDGQHAIDQALRRKPELVLMDLAMPGMDGLEVIRRFRTDTALARVPIVALTGNVSQSARDDACRTGATGFLEKPVDLPALERFLSTYVRAMVDTK